MPVKMNQTKSTIELPNSFQTESWKRRVAGKSFKKIRYRQNCFLIRVILTVKKNMYENLKHTVKKHLAQKIKKYSHFQAITTNNGKHFFRFHIKQYWHIHRVTAKQYYTLFQTWNNTGIFRDFIPNYTMVKTFFRMHIRQYRKIHNITQ